MAGQCTILQVAGALRTFLTTTPALSSEEIGSTVCALQSALEVATPLEPSFEAPQTETDVRHALDYITRNKTLVVSKLFTLEGSLHPGAESLVASRLLSSTSMDLTPTPYIDERNLLERFRTETSNRKRLQTLEILRELYSKKLLKGGAAGLFWIDRAKPPIIKKIREERDYADFFVPDDTGTYVCDLSEQARPAAIFLPLPLQTEPPPVIYLRSEKPGKIGSLAYFRIDSFPIFQDIVSEPFVEEVKKDLAAGRGYLRSLFIKIIHDPRGYYYIDDGHHRAVAARDLEHNYIFGRIVGHGRVVGKAISVAQIRRVSYEEFQRRVQEIWAGDYHPLQSPFRWE